MIISLAIINDECYKNTIHQLKDTKMASNNRSALGTITVLSLTFLAASAYLEQRNNPNLDPNKTSFQKTGEGMIRIGLDTIKGIGETASDWTKKEFGTEQQYPPTTTSPSPQHLDEQYRTEYPYSNAPVRHYN